MKTNKDDFAQFQKYFTEYQQRFGLIGYQVYFKYERIEDSHAKLDIDEAGKIVTVTLNSKLPKDAVPFQNIKRSAKHEALHLLIDELEDLIWRRFLTKEEIISARETLVHKLLKLIDD